MKLSIRLARQSLRSHKARSRLATLGVTVSVFLISLVFIISDSIKANLHTQVDQLPGHTIIVNGASRPGALNVTNFTPESTLDTADAREIQGQISSGSVISNLIMPGTLSFENRQVSANTIATTLIDPTRLNLTMFDGNWFDSSEQSKKWVILGADLANRLIGDNHAKSQVIDIKGEKFTVIGILQNTDQALSILGYNINQSAFIPLTSGQQLADGNKISQLIITGLDDVDDARQQIARILVDNHADPSDYSVKTGKEISQQLTELIDYITISACIIAAIILIISCISIASAMLVSTIERQHEIGIRKAVGATTRNIMGQFIAESLIMSLRGGIIGLLLAYAIGAIILLFLSISLTFSWLALAVGFVVPIIIGIIAGTYPAYRAAKHDIITALNQLT